MGAKSGVLIEPRFKENRALCQVTFETNPYDIAQGLVRNIQKFMVIMLTTKGTDVIRPWFGTYFSSLPRTNIGSPADIKLFVKDQVADAQAQFIKLQGTDAKTLDAVDTVTNITISDIVITSTNKVAVYLLFTGGSQEAITVSLVA